MYNKSNPSVHSKMNGGMYYYDAEMDLQTYMYKLELITKKWDSYSCW